MFNVAPPAPVWRDPEQVEAECRRLMSKHAAIVPRGWQGRKERFLLHCQIDRLLDEWLILSGKASC